MNSIFKEKEKPNDLDLNGLFTCTETTQILVGNRKQKSLFDSCQNGKHLQYDGKISENICVKGVCSRFGEKCPSSLFNPKKNIHVSLSCKISDNTSLSFSNLDTNTDLKPAKLLSQKSDSKTEYCCRNANSDNSTFLEVLGEGCFDKWRDVARFYNSCIFSDWIYGGCEKEIQNVYRVCLIPDTSCI